MENHQLTNEIERERGKKGRYKITRKDKMAVLYYYTSIIILNVNRLNSLIKKYRITAWIKKQDPTIFYLQKTHFSSKDTRSLKGRIEDDGLSKKKPKESGYSHTPIKHNRLQVKKW